LVEDYLDEVAFKIVDLIFVAFKIVDLVFVDFKIEPDVKI